MSNAHMTADEADAHLADLLGDEDADKPELDLDTSDSQVPTEPDKSIHVALSDVMRDIGAIGKTQRNDKQNFDYRGIDDICNAASPLFKKHGVTLSAEIVGDIQRTQQPTRSGGVLFYSVFKVRYTFWARDGTSRTTEAVGEGMDSGDKASNKAMSVAMKYAILQMLCIPTAMSDSDSGTPEPRANPKANANAATAQPRGEAVSPDVISCVVKEWKAQHGSKTDPDQQWPSYVAWVNNTTGRTFAPNKTAEWTKADAAKCCEALGIQP